MKSRLRAGSPHTCCMEDFAKMDLFFIVTTVAVAVVATLAAAVLFQAFRLMRAFERILRVLEAEAEELAEDLDKAREGAKREGRRLSRLFDIALAALSGMFGKRKR